MSQNHRQEKLAAFEHCTSRSRVVRAHTHTRVRAQKKGMLSVDFVTQFDGPLEVVSDLFNCVKHDTQRPHILHLGFCETIEQLNSAFEALSTLMLPKHEAETAINNVRMLLAEQPANFGHRQLLPISVLVRRCLAILLTQSKSIKKLGLIVQRGPGAVEHATILTTNNLENVFAEFKGSACTAKDAIYAYQSGTSFVLLDAAATKRVNLLSRINLAEPEPPPPPPPTPLTPPPANPPPPRKTLSERLLERSRAALARPDPFLR